MASIATYYSNYFAAVSFLRLHLRSVTHLAGGAAFEVVATDGPGLILQIAQRGRPLRHREVWDHYYAEMIQMAWPDAASATLLAPNTAGLKYRELLFRERVNYRAGEGFTEIHLSQQKYRESIRSVESIDRTTATMGLDDDAYTDRLAAERLSHVAYLMRRLEDLRCDPDIEAMRWRQREALVRRYAADPREARMGREILNQG